jgi:hypothetical protein
VHHSRCPWNKGQGRSIAGPSRGTLPICCTVYLSPTTKAVITLVQGYNTCALCLLPAHFLSTNINTYPILSISVFAFACSSRAPNNKPQQHFMTSEGLQSTCLPRMVSHRTSNNRVFAEHLMFNQLGVEKKNYCNNSQTISGLQYLEQMNRTSYETYNSSAFALLLTLDFKIVNNFKKNTVIPRFT